MDAEKIEGEKVVGAELEGEEKGGENEDGVEGEFEGAEEDLEFSHFWMRENWSFVRFLIAFWIVTNFFKFFAMTIRIWDDGEILPDLSGFGKGGLTKWNVCGKMGGIKR